MPSAANDVSLASQDECYPNLPPDLCDPAPDDQILHVAVVGAGIAGLSAAIGLARSGHCVEVSTNMTWANSVGEWRLMHKRWSEGFRTVQVLV